MARRRGIGCHGSHRSLRSPWYPDAVRSVTNNPGWWPNMQEQKARIRCWEDQKGRLHLGANESGRGALVDTLRRLIKQGAPARAKVALDSSPMYSSPVGEAGRIFTQLRRVLLDDAEQLHSMFAHPLNHGTCEIQMSPQFIHTFTEVCQEMNGRYQDTCLGPKSVDRRERRHLRARDKESAEIWFWGDWGL